MSKDFSKFTSYKGKGASVSAPGESENTAFNHGAVTGSAQRVSNASKASTDYSIPGKKRSSYKAQGD